MTRIMRILREQRVAGDRLREREMGDHRISFKATFEMHGVTKTWNQYINNYDSWPDDIRDSLEAAVREAMQKYWDEDLDYQLEKAEKARVEKEAQERALLADLKAKYEPQTQKAPTDPA